MEEVLSQIWDVLSFVFGGIGRGIERGITGLFGSSNARYLKKLQPVIDAINALEPRYQAMTDAELREQTVKFRKRLAAGETLDDLLPEAFAVCREAGRRVIGLRHYDVQLMGGIVLHRGNIAEMVTGEGKTLVATLPAYLNALEKKGVHVVTVNDYLARRDMEWMGPIYMSLGLTVGAIQSDMPTEDRQKAYECDITYGTNNEFGFDYLRDNMRPAAKGDKHFEKSLQQSQGPLNFAIIDEVDNILIDEARTPLIISGPAHDDVTRYAKADRIARQLKKGTHFEVNEKDHTAHLTDEGVRAAEQLAGVESFYTAGHMEWPHLIDNALKAHHLYKRDVNYVVNGDEVVIVDEFTGRLMPGRNWSDGLHQAVEAKEAGAGVRIKEENQTLATITLQNFFKLYKKICGMTGTAMTEAGEFWKIYKLDVIAIPTNKPLQRVNNPDVIYRSEHEKFAAIADEIERMHKWDVLVNEKGEEYLGKIIHETDGTIEFQPRDSKDRETIQKKAVQEIEHRGRPVLVGTVSIERSELISSLLERRGIPHEVLNAKHHQREAEIVAQAGRLGAVTIATNMAGRGTDIILGGNPEAMAWAKLQEKYPSRLEVPQEEWDSLVREIESREQMKAEGRMVAGMGGLHILGTERHEARRIDLQLRGRCGRQGDPGSSRFYLSLEDDLMRIFAGEWVKNVLTRLGMKEGEAIESHMVSRRIEGAQKKVEERNFEVRKNLLEYDEVMDEQRKRVYGYRQNILNGSNCKQLILDMIDQQIEHYLDLFLDKDYGAETFAGWASKLMSVELEPKDFRGLDFHGAEIQARDQAERMAEGQVLEALEENLPEEEEPSEWNWEALAKLVNSRWHLSLRDRDLRQLGRDQVGDFLIERARTAVQKIDLSEGARFLEPDFGVQTACNWVKHKFSVDLAVEDVRNLDPTAFKNLVREKARAVYDEKEAEFPVIAGLYHFTTRDTTGHKRYEREGLAEWAAERFHVDLSIEDLKNKQREEIRAILVERSREFSKGHEAAVAEIPAQLACVFNSDVPEERALRAAYEDGRLQQLSTWLAEKYNYELTPNEMLRLNAERLERHLNAAVEERFRPEMRRMERALVLELLDTAWKDHLLAMDHLRSSVGLRGYAQVDPKVEYKREGMRIFEEMWTSVDERVTDLVFRMEQLDEGFVGSTWTVTETVHQDAQSASEIVSQQQAAIEGSEVDHKPQPIRNRQQHVGRNDPCPCGSNKKFKNCCMKKG
ncbi:MAG: SEC-C domain-containing protein [Planctomycetaceae bacterium]|nr:SEC-C domain-containing protein [Planctomycetaceae bacterium]